jgi:hypothetical protein
MEIEGDEKRKEKREKEGKKRPKTNYIVICYPPVRHGG